MDGTAESAQSTPTHPWPTELHPRKLFCMRAWRERLADRFAHSFSWKRLGSRLTIPAHTRTKRDATAQYNDDDDNAI